MIQHGYFARMAYACSLVDVESDPIHHFGCDWHLDTPSAKIAVKSDSVGQSEYRNPALDSDPTTNSDTVSPFPQNYDSGTAMDAFELTAGRAPSVILMSVRLLDTISPPRRNSSASHGALADSAALSRSPTRTTGSITSIWSACSITIMFDVGER